MDENTARTSTEPTELGAESLDNEANLLPLEDVLPPAVVRRIVDGDASQAMARLTPVEQRRFAEMFRSGTIGENPLMAEITFLRLLAEDEMTRPSVPRAPRAPNGEPEHYARVWMDAVLEGGSTHREDTALRRAYEAVPEGERQGWRADVERFLARRIRDYREALLSVVQAVPVRDPERLIRLANAVGHLEAVRMRIPTKIQDEAIQLRLEHEERQLLTLLHDKLQDNLALLWEICVEYNARLGRHSLWYMKSNLEVEARGRGQLGPDEYFPDDDTILRRQMEGWDDIEDEQGPEGIQPDETPGVPPDPDPEGDGGPGGDGADRAADGRAHGVSDR